MDSHDETSYLHGAAERREVLGVADRDAMPPNDRGETANRYQDIQAPYVKNQ